jgi:hypothetical protein
VKYECLRSLLCRLGTSRAFMILTLALILTTSTVYACHPTTHLLLLPDKRMALSEFVGGIVTRSAELNYVTEQDSEVFAFYRNTPVAELSDKAFVAILRRPIETRIVRQSWSSFFEARTRNDPTGRWKALQEYLEANLTSLTVFRLPRDAPYGAQYDLYAIGIFNGETVVGVQMFGVAT